MTVEALENDYRDAVTNFGERNPITLGAKSAWLVAAFEASADSFEENYDEWEAHLADLDTLLGYEHPDNIAFREHLLDAYISFEGYAEATREAEVLLDAYTTTGGDYTPDALRTRTLLTEMALMSGQPGRALPHFQFLQTVADKAGVEGLVSVVANLHFHLIGAGAGVLSDEDLTALATDYLARYGGDNLDDDAFMRQEKVRTVLLGEHSLISDDDMITLAHNGMAATQQRYGAGHPAVLDSMVAFAAALEQRGKLPEAVDVIDDMLTLLSRADAATDPMMIASLHRRAARLRIDYQDYPGAHANYEQALAIVTRTGVEQAILGTRYDMAVLQALRGDVDTAIAELRTLLTDGHSADYVFLNAVTGTLASLLADQGLHDEALRLKEELTERFDTPDHRMELATWCESVGLFDRARTEYAEIYRQLHAQGKAETPFAKAVAERMKLVD